MWRKLALPACLAISAFAQDAVTNATFGPWTAELNGVWRWHAGDDVQWAAPSFDDSNWPGLKVPGPPPNQLRYWIRIPVQFGKVSDPGLTLGPIAYAYDVYWDGQRIGSFGNLSHGRWLTPRWKTFHLPRNLAGPGGHVIAIRAGESGYGFERPERLYSGDNRVGDIAALNEAESAHMRADFQPRSLQLLVSFGLLLAGLYFLLLPPAVAQGSAFRWLGLILLARALTVMCEFYMNDGPLNTPGIVPVALVWALSWLICIGIIEFPYALFQRRVPLAMRCVECLLALIALPVPFPYSEGLFRFIVFLIPGAVPIALAWAEFRKRTVDAGLTLAIFAILGAATLNVALSIILAAIFHVRLPIDISIAGFRLWTWDLAYLLWVPAVTTQIYKTNLRLRDERERLRGEMEAARHIQEVLVPTQSVHAPGFDIDVSYQPATEVGGDFFQLFSAPNDSLLVVVGDVSGKGMRAALLVSVIVGALQNRRSDSPSALLHELNSVLVSRSEAGFTTCCCALFAADGAVTIANAGHLAPYRNGEEIATSPALPLGVDADAHWSETHVYLHPSDRMVWISDGVVEARNGKHDLLGFQRTQELTTQSASEIARAAQQFGQEDDITVVSITRLSVPVYVA